MSNLLERFVEAGGVALIMAVMGVVAVVVGAHELWLSSASVASTCTVLETSTRRGKRDTDFVPQVRLAHEVAGRRYERLDEGTQRSQADAAAALARFPKGKTVACRYVEGRPDQVIVFEDRPGWLVLTGGLVLLGIAALGYFGSRKRPRGPTQPR